MLLWLPRRLKSTVPIPTPTNNPIKGLFNNENWILKPPQLLNVPRDELNSAYFNKPGSTKLNFVTNSNSGNDNGNPYIKNAKFRQNLDSALQWIYHTQINTINGDKSINDPLRMNHRAWLRLRDYIYSQLNDPDIQRKIDSYQPMAMDYIQPSNPSILVPQLCKADEIDLKIWQDLLPSPRNRNNNNRHNDVISDSDKFIHLLSKMTKYLLEKEVLPFSLRVKDIDSLDVSNIYDPIQWFPEARKMKRRIVMHLGPTNSGKTYRALKRLKEVEKGYYGGPLRLLAREVYERFKNEGTPCNLLTGEEVIWEYDSLGNKVGLTSGTVEMIPLNGEFDVVVIDEIQMMGDEDRGWAWTNALLGCKAREIHLCGEPSVLPIVKELVKLTGDKLEVNEYERLGKLVVERRPVGKDLKSSLRKGDCIVAFSKKRILDMKLKIERETGFKVAVIYGSLPPETRVQQASLFNNGECDILVASDAIGMGLNLSIDRIIFTTDMKFDGKEMRYLTASNIKQIGGRAGRFKHDKDGKRPRGYITAMDSQVLKNVRKAIQAPVRYLDKVMIWPTDEICEQMLVKYPPTTSVHFLLRAFEKRLRRSQNNFYELSNLDVKLETLGLFEYIENIPFKDKLRLSTAPVKSLPLVKRAFVKFCETIANGHTRGLLSYKFPFELLDYRFITDESVGLEPYESLYNIIMLFLWLHNRYPEYFIDVESARDLKYFCEMIIFEKIDRLKKNPYLQSGSNNKYFGTRYPKPHILSKSKGFRDFHKAL